MAGLLNAQHAVASLFESAGITVNGTNPWDPLVHRNRFYPRLIAQGSLGLGEAYMDGDWDCERLDQFFDRVIPAKLGDKLGITPARAMLLLKSKLRNRQTVRRAKQAADVHYDLPIDIFEATFDNRLTGSCGYWKNATSLDASQTAKLDLVCRKVGLARGMRVLDIGCGWG